MQNIGGWFAMWIYGCLHTSLKIKNKDIEI